MFQITSPTYFKLLPTPGREKNKKNLTVDVGTKNWCPAFMVWSRTRGTAHIYACYYPQNFNQMKRNAGGITPRGSGEPRQGSAKIS